MGSFLNGDSSPASEKEVQKMMMASATMEIGDNDFLIDEFSQSSSEAQGQAFYRLAKVYYDKSDLDSAEDYFERALQLTEFPRNIFGSLKIIGFLIRISFEKLENNKVADYIKQSATLLDDYAKEAPTLNAEYFYYYGMNRSYQKDYADAIKSFDLAFRKTQEENEPDLGTKVLFAYANSLFQQKNYQKALEVLSQLHDLLEIINKEFLKGSLYLLRGNILAEINEYKEALTNYELALKMMRVKKSWNLYCYILLGMGKVSKRLGEFSKAMVFFDLAGSSIDSQKFKHLHQLITQQVEDVNDSSVDIYLDKHNRLINEKDLGVIDFKHRFVLLEILFLLAKRPGIFFDKEALAREIWKDEYNPLIHDKLIYTSVSRLRKLIEPKASENKYIVRGKDGYTFNPRIKARFCDEKPTPSYEQFGSLEFSTPI